MQLTFNLSSIQYREWQEEWFEGAVYSFNGVTQKYGVYFPSDGQTAGTYRDDEDMEICITLVDLPICIMPQNVIFNHFVIYHIVIVIVPCVSLSFF